MDLSTTYMGLKLKSPIAASASPLSARLETIKQLEDAGASAVVMFSLFEEQVKHDEAEFDYFMSYGTERFAESLSYFPQIDDYSVGPDQYLDLVAKAAESCDVPIIGSLNGISPVGWSEYAKKIEAAGARGIELNVYFIPTELDMTGDLVEQKYIDILMQVKDNVSIPVAMKLGPYFSSMANMAKRLADAGADALVLFNRFYQPDFDVNKLEVEPSLELSSANELRLPLLWTAVLSGKVDASIGAGTGVQTGADAAKFLLAGADAVFTASALLRNGPDYIGKLNAELEQFLKDKAYDSLEQMKGAMNQQSVADPTAFERANYIRILENYKNEYCRDANIVPEG